MRRADRELTDREELIAVMEGSDVCRLALFDEAYPYLIPLNFGIKAEGEELILYFHGANEGKKHELIRKSPHASFEMDRNHVLFFDEEKKSCSMAYESVVGQGELFYLSEEEKLPALRRIMAHYRRADFPFSEAVASRTCVFALRVRSMTGKRRLVK